MQRLFKNMIESRLRCDLKTKTSCMALNDIRAPNGPADIFLRNPSTLSLDLIDLAVDSPGALIRQKIPMTKFLYFAYGSNLLAKRILLQNPTAVIRGIAKLNDYRIDFNRADGRWGGCSATIVSDPGKHVWGTVWEIEKSQMENLDQQEGVAEHIYTPLQVQVVTPSGEIIECRVYKLIDEPEPYHFAELLPEQRRPSRVYLETILQGAVESKLPADYIHFLKSFPHNGFSGPVQVHGLNITFSMTSD